MKLVLLAAGFGTRFGGLKQIAPIGPHGEALMDYTVRASVDAGYDGIVLVVRESIRDEVVAHVRTYWPPTIPVEIAIQPDRPGTAYAVLCAAPFIGGPFAMCNADDLYAVDALASIRHHFDSDNASNAVTQEYVLVGYELGRTVCTSAEVKRGVCSLDAYGRLMDITELRVTRDANGTFSARSLHAESDAESVELSATAPVSMNLWGFSPHVFDRLESATEPFEPHGPTHEILLPEVIRETLAEDQARVRVLRTSSHCLGVTHREDVGVVQRYLEGRHDDKSKDRVA